MQAVRRRRLAEELAVADVAAVEADERDAGAVAGEQRADAVELGREDLEHHERERELRQRRRACSHRRRVKLDLLLSGEYNRASTVETKVVGIFWVWLLGNYQRIRSTLEDQSNELQT